MARTRQWNFYGLTVRSHVGDLDDVVVSVRWQRLAEETVNDTPYSASVTGDVVLAPATPNTFVPFADLTAEQVQTWVEAQLNASTLTVSDIDDKVDALLEDQINPTERQVSPPWQ